MPSDTSFLKQRRQTWYFQVAVPRDVQRALGVMRGGAKGKLVRVIIQSLRTRDKFEAQRLRWEKHREALDLFDRLRGRKTLTLAEIEEAAEAKYRAFLTEAHEGAEKGSPLAYAVDDDGHDDEYGGLDIQLDHLLEALTERNYTGYEHHIQAILAAKGADVPRGSQLYIELCESQIRALIEATRGRMAFLEGKPYEPERPFTKPVIDPVTLQVRRPVVARKKHTPSNGEKFVDAAARYVAAMMRDPSAAWTQQTKLQYEATFRLFADYLNGASAAAVTREDAAKFLDLIATLDPNYGRVPGAKKNSLSSLLEKYGGKGRSLTNKTVNRHSAALSKFFKWAKSVGVCEGDNPFSGQRRKVGKTERVPLNDDELAKLLASPTLAKSRRNERIRPSKHSTAVALGWVPLIALFSGMRSEEICQLRLADIKREQNVWFFNVTEEDGQKVKTEAGVRKVPVHSALIKAGLMQYVDHIKGDGQNGGRLFPGLQPGGPDGKFNWYFTKAVGTHFTKLGITRKNVTFHSLRKNVVNALERARVHQSEAALIVGHERGFTYSQYNPVGLELPALSKIVEKIKYPRIGLAHL